MTKDESQNGPAASQEWRIDTLIAHAGLDPRAYHGFVNPPVVRASTVVFENVDALLNQHTLRYSYGLSNTPTIEALTTALTALDGAAGTVLVPSGLAAVTVSILAVARSDTSILVPDNVYGPTRRFCDESLPALGIRTVYYDPLVGGGIAGQLQNVSAVVIEAPGSLTFEMPDIPSIVAAARQAGAFTIMDNTWATPLIFKPLDHGVDIAAYAGTKYFGGHADLLLGSISVNESAWPHVKRMHRNLGVQAGPEEIWLTLRGLRTLGVRMERHEKSTIQIATWLQTRPEVSRVLHPALPDDPGHAIWQRDFGRTSGLFGFVLNGTDAQARAFVHALHLFALGESWGGFESLAVLVDLQRVRTVRPWTEGPVIRLHVGLEDVRDLIADLERGFAAMAAA